MYHKELEAVGSKKYKLFLILPASLFLMEKVLHYEYQLKMDGYLRKKLLLLYPEKELELRLRLHWADKISYILVVITAASLLALLISFSHEGGNRFNTIQRPYYHQRDRYVGVEAHLRLDDTIRTKPYSIRIPKQLPDSETAQHLLEEAAEYLPHIIKGDNEDLMHVCHSLNLVTIYPNTDICIEWHIDNPSFINQQGELLCELTQNRKEKVNCTATLSYLGLNKAKEISITLVPLNLSPEEKLLQAELELDALLKNPLEGQDDSEEVVLPNKINEVDIHWSKRESQHLAIKILILGLIGGVLVFIGKDYEITQKIQSRNNDMRKELPELIYKLNLLIYAGMTISRAWTKIVEDYNKALSQSKIKEKTIYEQMKITLQEINNGIPEIKAYEAFGKRCGIPEMLRFSTLLIQNLKKGNETVIKALYEQSKEAWTIRKSLAIKLGERASTKLLLPMGIMLVIILLIVIMPAMFLLRV